LRLEGLGDRVVPCVTDRGRCVPRMAAQIAGEDGYSSKPPIRREVLLITAPPYDDGMADPGNGGALGEEPVGPGGVDEAAARRTVWCAGHQAYEDPDSPLRPLRLVQSGMRAVLDHHPPARSAWSASAPGRGVT